MRVKHIQLRLTLDEFRALEKHIGGLQAGTKPQLNTIYHKLFSIRERLDITDKLLERIPLREA